MATELGVGYVSILPSTSKFGAALNKELSGPITAAAGAAGATSGRSYGSRFAASFKKSGASVTRVIKGLAVGGGIGAALFAGSALKLGYDRLTTIENATAQLTNQLGSASKAAKFTDAIVKTVSGTPFNLDQFLDAGASLVSMGADAQKVPGYLTAIGNVAATKGKQANDFASRLSLAFGQAATQGKLTGDTLLQMSQAGVPALKILANGFGVSTGEMSKMVSKGLVPADKGLDILTKGIGKGTSGAAGKTVGFAGNMEKLRKTTTGAAGGFKSAMARIGAAVLKPALPALASAATKGADALDGITKKIPELVKQFESSKRGKDIIRDISTVLRNVGTAVQKTVTKVKPFVKAFADFVVHNPKPFLIGLAVVIGGVMLSAVVSLTVAVFALLSPFVVVVGVIALIAAGFTLAYQKVGWFRGIVDGLVSVFTNFVLPVWRSIFNFIVQKFIPAVWQIAQIFIRVAAAVIGKVAAIVGAVVGIAVKVAGAAGRMFSPIKNAVTAVVRFVSDKIGGIVDTVKGIPRKIANVTSGMFDGIKNAWKSVFNGIANIWNSTIGKLHFTIPSWVPGIGGKGFSVPKIPKFHTGGLVPGGPGNEPVVQLQGGELVLSRDQVKALGGNQLRGRGVTIEKVTVNSGTDVDLMISRLGFALVRGSL